MTPARLFAVLVLCPALAAPAAAQSNTTAGLDVKLARLSSIVAMGREGTFPDGTNGVAFGTVVCNDGAVKVQWEKAMDPDHPFVGFVVAREMDGRMEQISDQSFAKHTFFALDDSFCTPCQGGDPIFGSFLGLGCSDTYTAKVNGDSFDLGPSEEIDPWLGLWNPLCSHFDKGEPPVAAPNDCNGQRSLTQQQANALGPVAHRIHVLDRDLQPQAPATLYYQANYVVKGEAEALRDDNVSAREFQAAFNGFSFVLTAVGDTFVGSTVLDKWTGATVSSAKNGSVDGRFVVGVRVTGPTNGLYHYEYAVFNRDNNRAAGSLRIPLCPAARIENAGFKDVDQDALTDWTIARTPSELKFSTSGAIENPLRWNAIYNFWFDSDAAPLGGALVLDAFFPGPGLPSVAVSAAAPLGLYNVDLGPGCSFGTPPALFANGRATLGNAGFELGVAKNEPGDLTFLFLGVVDGALALGGACVQHTAGLLGVDVLLAGSASAGVDGVARYPIAIPSAVTLEGQHVNVQAAALRLLGGPLFDQFDLSNGLRVRLGDTLVGCP